MIQDAISSLKDKTGSSQYAIAKFIAKKQENLPTNFKKILLIQLKRLVVKGKLVKVKASYKLPPQANKKLAAKLIPATKRKPVSNAKRVAKPKEASETKPKSKAIGS